jgi:hypothetical protein
LIVLAEHLATLAFSVEPTSCIEGSFAEKAVISGRRASASSM